MEVIIEKVREEFLKACQTSKFLSKDYEYHTGIVEKLSLQLAEKFNANKVIVQLAAILHDIGRIKYGPKDHEITSAEEAEKILNQFNISKEIIEKVKECILRHRHENGEIPELLEAKILKIADAWSHFKKPLYLLALRAAITQDIEKSLEWLKAKLERDLRFFEKIDLDIREVIEECKAVYQKLLSLF